MADETPHASKPEIDTIEKDERDTPEYWRRWIKSAERAAERHWDIAKKAWAEYENRELDRAGRFPIYYSSCKTLEPAYYARTPKITTRRRFDIKDEVSMTGCLIAERLGQYLIDCSEFDEVMHAAVQDFIHADKASLQIVYEHETESQEDRVPLTENGGIYTTPDGEEWTEEVFQDAQGLFGKRAMEIPVKQQIKLVACPYDEVLHTPDAKCNSEIREMAYYFCLNKDEAEARFGEKAKQISWKSKKDAKRKDGASLYERDRTESVGEYVEGWEIWSKPNKKVYWLSDQYQGGFLDEREDPYQLREFFPSPPFILGSKPSKSLYPTPAFGHLAPLIEDMHECAEKFSELLSGIERRALVNSADDEFLLALNMRGNGTYVAAPNLTNIVEKAGIESLIYWVPVEPLVQAMTELTGIQEKFKNEFYEWFGVPDILRGATEPVESATAQQLKAEAAHDRFKWNKKLVAQLARDSIEMMVDLALGVFDDAKVAECVGFDFMSPEDQARFPAALAMLRNDKARMIRIEVESDSMSFVDDQLRAQRVNEAVQTMTAGLKEVAQMMEISPQAAAIGLQALLLSLDTMPAGKSFYDAVKQTIESLIEQAKNPPEPPPPPPDYEAMKIELEQQKIQAQVMRAQMQLQAQMREADRKDWELQLKAGTDSTKMQLEQYKANLESMVQQFMMQIEAQRVQIEQFKAQMQARESEMEEIRLAREVEAKQYAAAVQAMQTQPPPEPTPPQIINVQPPAMPPINVVVDAKHPPVSKRINVFRDETGNAIGYQVEDINT